MINYYNTKVESEAGPPLSHVIDSLNFCCDTRVMVSHVARLLLMPAVQE
jgi:hypothetical protein